MGLILLEALGALVLLLLIVWWTMFSGRKRGELPSDATEAKSEAKVERSEPQKPETPTK